MKMKRIVGVLLILTAALGMCLGCAHSSAKAGDVESIKAQIEAKEIALELYYLDPDILTRRPLAVDDLMDLCDIQLSIAPEELYEHRETVFRMLDTPLVQIEEAETYLNARIYYVLKTKDGEALFEVAMWGQENAFLVNGTWCEGSKEFYDVAIELLPREPR